MKRISPKRKEKNEVWNEVCDKKFNDGQQTCERCLCQGTRDKAWIGTLRFYLDGHHKDHNRNNNILENCLLICRECHNYIEEHPAEAYEKGWSTKRGING